MAESRRQLSIEAMGRKLEALGRQFAYPDTPDIATGVRARLQREAARGDARSAATGRHRERVRGAADRRAWAPRWLRTRRGRRLGIALAAALLVLAAVFILSGNAAATLSRWLGVRGVAIVAHPATPFPTPQPIGGDLALGRRVTLEEARRQAHFRIVLPALAGFEHPDEVYLDTTGQVAFVYRTRPGLPGTSDARIGMLLTEFVGDPSPEHYMLLKGLEPGTHLAEVRVQGRTGYWLSGSPHMFLYAVDGVSQSESIRLAGNTLLWAHDTLTMRLESALGEAVALRIAESVR